MYGINLDMVPPRARGKHHGGYNKHHVTEQELRLLADEQLQVLMWGRAEITQGAALFVSQWEERS